MRAVDEHGKSHAFRDGRNLKATLSISSNLSAFDERKEQMEIRRPTKMCFCHYLTFLPTYLTEPDDDGQSRQVPTCSSTSTSSDGDGDSVCL